MTAKNKPGRKTKAKPPPEDGAVGILVPAGVDATQRRQETVAPQGAGVYRCTRTIRGRHRSYFEGEEYELSNNFAPTCFTRIR